jgi:acyl-coenzyme A synthetase/AMP-(fatty) acid ligase
LVRFRKKYLIIRGGSNISPVEVERVLMAQPAVRDAAVVGVPDPISVSEWLAFVQLADSAQSVDLNEILAFATKRLVLAIPLGTTCTPSLLMTCQMPARLLLPKVE